jgi:hypothetical protein
MKKNRILYITSAALILVAITVLIIFNSRKYISTPKNIEINKNAIIGDWVRTDASYLIRINNVNKDGTLEAQYFNPKPINVETATLEESYGNLKITLVLRDVNYPGSKYTLNYLPDRDILAGEYFQAVEILTFYVEFVRQNI